MIARLRHYRLEMVWVALAAANYAARMVWQNWATIPLHAVWLGFTALCALRIWPVRPTRGVVVALSALAVASLAADGLGVRLWNEAFEVPPLMAMLLLTFLWRGRREAEAHQLAEHRAERRTETLERRQRFLHDVSHELRAPVTIARGHVELALRHGGTGSDLEVALEELGRIDGIIERMLLLAAAQEPDFVLPGEFELEPFLEDVLIRWSGAAPRAWRLGPVAEGWLRADPERLRTALDALLENAVKYTEADAEIELRARARGEGGLVIEVRDEGSGVPEAALERIFDRFARADTARRGSVSGVGLGLAIVDAIAKRHGGRCTVRSDTGGSVFALELPGFRAGDPTHLVGAPSSAKP